MVIGEGLNEGVHYSPNAGPPRAVRSPRDGAQPSLGAHEQVIRLVVAHRPLIAVPVRRTRECWLVSG